MKLTFILAVITSALSGFIYAQKGNNVFSKRKTVLVPCLITALIAGFVLSLFDAAATTEESSDFSILTSSIIGFATLVAIGFIIAKPRKVINRHTDLAQIGLPHKLCIAINITTIVLWLICFIGTCYLLECIDITSICIATLLTCILFALLHIIIYVITALVCIVLLIIRGIKHFL